MLYVGVRDVMYFYYFILKFCLYLNFWCKGIFEKKMSFPNRRISLNTSIDTNLIKAHAMRLFFVFYFKFSVIIFNSEIDIVS